MVQSYCVVAVDEFMVLISSDSGICRMTSVKGMKAEGTVILRCGKGSLWLNVRMTPNGGCAMPSTQATEAAPA